MSSMIGRRWLDARRCSLTARMTVFFGTAIAVIVTCVSAMMYIELVQQLQEKEETELLEDVHIQQQLLANVQRKSPQSGWQHEWREQQDDIGEFAWQLLDTKGNILEGSRNATGFAYAPGQTAASTHFARISNPGANFDGTYLVLGAAFVDADGGKVLRGILDVTQDERVLRRYLAKSLVVVVLAIASSVFIGWFLARRSLAPVRAISADIGRINAEQLDTRIAQEAWPTELGVLAETFDEMMARIEPAFDQLSRFSSDLAHEFRSPINNLVAAASVTLGRARTAEEYQTTLEVVVDEGVRLSRMVSSMLFLARADNAKQLVQLEDLSTEKEFCKLLEFFGILAEEQGVTLEADGNVPVRADPLLLRQALSNLLANALRYTARGGMVRLKALAEADHIVISVTDNGAGIASEHLPFLFDRFYRADAARSSVDSSGLGLAVVRSIVELHCGSVDVRSRLGEGATFELRMPKDTAGLSR